MRMNKEMIRIGVNCIEDQNKQSLLEGRFRVTSGIALSQVLVGARGENV